MSKTKTKKTPKPRSQVTEDMREEVGLLSTVPGEICWVAEPGGYRDSIFVQMSPSIKQRGLSAP